jgi:protein tyrosine phosphatase
MSFLVEQMLNEQPHVFLDMDDDREDGFWDFCAEDKPKSWIVQLVELYAFKKLETINKRKNRREEMYLNDGEIDDFTQNLNNDPFFQIQARQCIADLRKEGKDRIIYMLQKYLPGSLKHKLGL